MEYKDFEDFLRWRHADQYVGTDDMMIEDFERWVQDLTTDDWINYGNKYGKSKLI